MLARRRADHIHVRRYAATRGDDLNYAYKKMRINSKDTVGGFPTLLVRKLVRALTNCLYWDLETVERILHLGPNEASGR